MSTDVQKNKYGVNILGLVTLTFEIVVKMDRLNVPVMVVFF